MFEVFFVVIFLQLVISGQSSLTYSGGKIVDWITECRCVYRRSASLPTIKYLFGPAGQYDVFLDCD